jgi:hypothetical protein
VELYRVRDYELLEPFALRIFGLSNIRIVTVDESKRFILMQAIKDGPAVVDHLRNAVEQIKAEKQVRAVDVSTFG